MSNVNDDIIMTEEYNSTIQDKQNRIDNGIKDVQKVYEGGQQGIKNLGNTCYMSSALQCLFHTKELVEYFFSKEYSNDLYNDTKLFSNEKIHIKDEICNVKCDFSGNKYQIVENINDSIEIDIENNLSSNRYNSNLHESNGKTDKINIEGIDNLKNLNIIHDSNKINKKQDIESIIHNLEKNRNNFVNISKEENPENQTLYDPQKIFILHKEKLKIENNDKPIAGNEEKNSSDEIIMIDIDEENKSEESKNASSETNNIDFDIVIKNEKDKLLLEEKIEENINETFNNLQNSENYSNGLPIHNDNKIEEISKIEKYEEIRENGKKSSSKKKTKNSRKNTNDNKNRLNKSCELPPNYPIEKLKEYQLILFTQNFKDLIHQMWSKEITLINPKEFRESLICLNSQFNNFCQQDAHELLTFILESLHLKLNRANFNFNDIEYNNYYKILSDDVSNFNLSLNKTQSTLNWENHVYFNDSIINDHFYGLLLSSLTCKKCYSTNVTYEPFNHLGLSVPNEFHLMIYFVPNLESYIFNRRENNNENTNNLSYDLIEINKEVEDEKLNDFNFKIIPKCCKVFIKINDNMQYRNIISNVSERLNYKIENGIFYTVSNNKLSRIIECDERCGELITRDFFLFLTESQTENKLLENYINLRSLIHKDNISKRQMENNNQKNSENKLELYPGLESNNIINSDILLKKENLIINDSNISRIYYGDQVILDDKLEKIIDSKTQNVIDINEDDINFPNNPKEKEKFNFFINYNFSTFQKKKFNPKTKISGSSYPRLKNFFIDDNPAFLFFIVFDIFSHAKWIFENNNNNTKYKKESITKENSNSVYSSTNSKKGSCSSNSLIEVEFSKKEKSKNKDNMNNINEICFNSSFIEEIINKNFIFCNKSLQLDEYNTYFKYENTYEKFPQIQTANPIISSRKSERYSTRIRNSFTYKKENFESNYNNKYYGNSDYFFKDDNFNNMTGNFEDDFTNKSIGKKYICLFCCAVDENFFQCDCLNEFIIKNKCYFQKEKNYFQYRKPKIIQNLNDLYKMDDFQIHNDDKLLLTDLDFLKIRKDFILNFFNFNKENKAIKRISNNLYAELNIFGLEEFIKAKYREINICKEFQSKSQEESMISLYDLLDYFTGEEKLREDFFCTTCNENVSRVKKLEINKFPNILIINFKRFRYDLIQTKGRSTRRGLDSNLTYISNNLYFGGEKIETKIDFPLKLDLKKFNRYGETIEYDLYAICNHEGKISGGHYKAICNDFQTNKWFEFDDKIVKPVNEDTIVSHKAYILFYRKKNDL